MVLILVSVGMMGFVMYKMANADAAEKSTEFWTNKKFLLYTPTILNVLSMVAVGVLILT